MTIIDLILLILLVLLIFLEKMKILLSEKHQRPFQKRQWTNLNNLIFFFHVEISWPGITHKIFNCFCKLILHITCQIHFACTIPNNISNALHWFTICKTICSYVSFVKQFSCPYPLMFIHNFGIQHSFWN